MRITDKYVFFWDGIYSQWYNSPMTIDGVTYNCCEQYMMHQKALLFRDFETADKIMATTSPREQKSLGREVKDFDATAWSMMSFGVVYTANIEKFRQNQGLLSAMLATDDRIFVEASPFDKIWGIGRGEDALGVENPASWLGQNLLGWALTLVKRELQAKQSV